MNAVFESHAHAVIGRGVLLAVLMFSGCTTPDRWYDIEGTSYEQPSESVVPIDPAELPVAEWQEPAPLPDIDQGRLSLSIEQAVLLTLRRNRELQVERFAPVIAGTFEALERGVFDPELFGELAYFEETTSQTARSTGERFNVEGQDENVEVGLRQRLPTGTNVEASVAHARSTSNRTPEQQEARVGLSMTQSLLEGFGPAVNLVDVRQAQLGTRASLYELRGFVEALVAETEIAYWHYVLAGEQITIFERSLEIARRQLDEVEQRIEVGVLPRIDAAAARAEVARREQALIEARSDWEERRLRLLRLLNASSDEHFQLEIMPTSPPSTTIVALTDLDDRLALADRLRPDLNEARLRLEQTRLEVVRTRNGLLPRLELFIDLGKTGYADTFGKAFRNLDGETYDLTAGIRFSTYLGNRQDRARDLAARASRDQSEAAIANLRDLAQLDVRLALNQTERARQQIQASSVTRAFAEETVKAEQERFAVGASTSLLVAQAQRDLLASQLAEIEAIVNYRIALVNLYLAEGGLLERRGIRLEGTGALNVSSRR